MRSIDINCDLGEMEDGRDVLVMPFISSCNIACGGHAGNPDLMLRAVQEAFRHHVSIGAHPGYADRVNFGRKSMHLTSSEVTMLIFDQVSRLQNIATRALTRVRYVKLHGALYHDAAKNKEIARAVIAGLKKTGLDLSVLGPGGSVLEAEAISNGFDFYLESFIDRRYDPMGQLVPRNEPNAVIGDIDGIEMQLKEITLESKVSTIDGGQIDLQTDSICIHGDHPGALENARAIKTILAEEGIAVKSFLT